MRGFGENVSSAFRSLASSWLHTTLTTLGIVIGVGSVVLLVSTGLGVQKEVTEQVQGLGANLVFVLPGKLDKNLQMNPMALLGVSTLTSNDVQTLSGLPSVNSVAPFLFVGGTAEYKGQATSAFVIATNASWFGMRPVAPAEGQLFTTAQENDNVCVMAQGPRETIFGNHTAVGETVMIRDEPFRVIGVLKEEQSNSLLGDSGFENMIYLPAGTVARRIERVQINRIIVQTDPAVEPERTIDSVSRTLLALHGGREDFGVVTQKQILGRIYKLMAIVTSFLTGISAISLFVAGVGIMNIMLMSVTERTYEIGIRKAVGARRRDVFVHFLTEALVISFAGGMAGLAAALAMCALVGRYSPLHPLVTSGVVALAFGVCVAVGLIFGTVPALRAARLHPIAALRHE